MSKPLMPKDPFSQTPPMNGAESLFTAAGETHQRIRKTLINAFSDRALKDQSPIIDSYANLLMTRLRSEARKDSASKVDLAKYYGYAALDIIADLTFGESFYGLEGDNEHSWILGFFLGAKFGSVRNSLSRFHPIDKIFGWMFLRLTAKNRARSWRIATDKISRRLEMGDLGPSRSDFITPVVGRLDETQKTGITRKELNTNGLAVVIAGCQLPTVALATSTYLLMRYPETLKELTKEIRESFESETDITIFSTMKLPYLAAVINETLRIHHPTPINLPRVVPPQGQMVGRYWVPGGVSTSLLSLELSKEIASKLHLEHHRREFTKHPERSRQLGGTSNFSPRKVPSHRRFQVPDTFRQGRQKGFPAVFRRWAELYGWKVSSTTCPLPAQRCSHSMLYSSKANTQQALPRRSTIDSLEDDLELRSRAGGSG